MSMSASFLLYFVKQNMGSQDIDGIMTQKERNAWPAAVHKNGKNEMILKLSTEHIFLVHSSCMLIIISFMFC